MRPESAPPNLQHQQEKPKSKMPFFKDFRRRKTSKDSRQLANGSNDSDRSDGTMATTKSSSTLNSVYASSTPASSIQPHQSTPSLPLNKSTSNLNSIQSTPLPQRPMPLSSVSNRSSFMVRETGSDLSNWNCADSHSKGTNTPSINGTTTPKNPLSNFAPRVLSVSDNSWVCWAL